MSADTFTSAMFLITAVMAAGVLINAVFPVVYTMAGTFNTASHQSDERMRTDFKIISTFVSTTASPRYATVWMKNVGSMRIANTELERSDVFCGDVIQGYERLTYTNNPVNSGEWGFDFFYPDYDLNNNGYWDPGETVAVYAVTNKILSTGSGGTAVYFQFALPNGVWRTSEFTAR